MKSPNLSLTLIDVLSEHAVARPDELAYIFLPEGEGDELSLTYRVLANQVAYIGRTLAQLGAGGQRVLLFYPAGLDFITAFLGCLYAGAVPIPLSLRHLRGPTKLLEAILADARPLAALTTETHESTLTGALQATAAALEAVVISVTNKIVLGQSQEVPPAAVTPESPAWLQYTSGSTQRPRGVVVSHANVMFNLAQIASRTQRDSASVGVTWLPHYHDMGLVDGLLQPLFSGYAVTIISPIAFLQRPSRWLRAISRYRATTSGGPNFAYELCLEKIKPGELEGVQLDTWQVAYNGAEPIRAGTLKRFAEKFSAWGFRPQALYPCYGLAEATLFVTGGTLGSGARTLTVERSELEQGRAVLAVDVPENDRAICTLVDCGHSLDDQSIVIVDPSSRTRCLDGHIGEIWVTGPSVASGYLNQFEETESTFGARLDGDSRRFLRTGDLAFIRSGSVFITGRIKDMLIVHGRNLYPQDVEFTAEESHPSLRPRCNALFAIERSGRTEVVLIQGVRNRDDASANEVIAAIRAEVFEEFGIGLDTVCLIPPSAVQKTSSGKVRRSDCASAFEAGELQIWAQSTLTDEILCDESESEVFEKCSITSASDVMAAEPGLRLGVIVHYLATVMRQVLRSSLPSEAVRLDLPLAALGIDSLGIAEFQQRIGSEMGLTIQLTDLSSASGLSQIAARLLRELDSGTQEFPGGGTSGPSPVDRCQEHPITVGQLALWQLQQTTPIPALLVNSMGVRIRGSLDCDALERAFRKWLDRHPAALSVFEGGDRVRRYIRPPSAECFTRQKVLGGEQANLEEQLRRLSRQGMDLETGPLTRAWLFEIGHNSSGDVSDALLLISAHHLVSDLGTLTILAEELPVLYLAARGHGPWLPPSSYAFSEYASWLQRSLDGERGRSLMEYWKRQLDEAPYLEIPGDRPRPPFYGHRGASVRLSIDAELTVRVKELSRHQGVTVFTTLLAAFQCLLASYADQSDVVVAVPTAPRAHFAWRRVVGYLANPVLLRTRLGGDPLVGDLLRRVGAAVAAGLEHADYPFTLAAELYNAGRDRRSLPPAPALFALHTSPSSNGHCSGAFALGLGTTRRRLGGLELEPFPIDPAGVQFDLELVLAEGDDGGLAGTLGYNTEIFKEVTARRLADGFLECVKCFSHEPSARLSTVQVADTSRLNAIGKGVKVAPPSDTADCVHQRFEQMAREKPNAIALAVGGRCWTYAELNCWANRLTQQLLALGVTREDRVGLGFGSSANFVAAMLAVLKAGGAFVPLDPSYPPDRLAYMIDDSGTSLILTTADAEHLFSDHCHHVLCLSDSDAASGGADADENSGLKINPRELAYLIYTSGSTGLPKAVAVEHRGLTSLVNAQSSVFELRSACCVSQIASPNYDASIFEIMLALCSGASLHVAEEVARHGGAALADWLRHERITHVTLTPSILMATPSDELPELRTVIAAGESCPETVVSRWAAARRFFNAYGPTEATIWSTVAECLPGVDELPPIGVPIPNSEVFLLDRYGRIAPAGASAEMFIGGEGVARGYVGKPALTAMSFVPNPFSDQPGERLFKSGDSGRYRDDGQIEFLGRRDSQVKIRGMRVELGEIEAALRRVDGVHDCAVVLDEWDKLVAYVVAEGSLDTPTRLRAALRRKIPESLVPAEFHMLTALPQTASGKVDRAALAGVTPTYEPPTTQSVTPMEARMAAIWQEILVIPFVGRDDHFFSLGGNSIAAARLVNAANSDLGIELPLRTVFEHPVLSNFALCIEQTIAARSSETTVAISSKSDLNSAEGFPLSFAQQRMWYMYQTAPRSSGYHCAGVIRLQGAVQASLLQSALDAVVRRHAILRTRFVDGHDEPRQMIVPFQQKSQFDFVVVDLSQIPAEQREAAAEQRIETESRKPFDLRHGPTMRVCFIKMAENDHALGVAMHHMVCDGWSVGIFLRELAEAYGLIATDPAATLPALPYQYADFAHDQKAAAAGLEAGSGLRFWEKTLASVQPMPWTTRVAAYQRRDGDMPGERLPFELGCELSSAVREFSRRAGVTLFTTLLASLDATLHALYGIEDITIGTDVLGRNWPQTDSLIGFFVNQVAIRVNLQGNPEFQEVVHRVWSAIGASLSHQEVPFEKVVERINPPRIPGQMPLFQVKLVLQPGPQPRLVLPALTTVASELFTGVAQMDLLLNLADSSEGVTGAWEFNTDRFERTTIAKWSDGLRAIVREAIDRPRSRLSDLLLSVSAALRESRTDRPFSRGMKRKFIAFSHEDTRVDEGIS